MLVQHRRADADEPSASRRRKTQFLHTGQKKCGLGEGPLPSSGSPWGHGDTAGRYGNGERNKRRRCASDTRRNGRRRSGEAGR
jgi:hypothetical protein